MLNLTFSLFATFGRSPKEHVAFWRLQNQFNERHALCDRPHEHDSVSRRFRKVEKWAQVTLNETNNVSRCQWCSRVDDRARTLTFSGLRRDGGSTCRHDEEKKRKVTALAKYSFGFRHVFLLSHTHTMSLFLSRSFFFYLSFVACKTAINCSTGCIISVIFYLNFIILL